MVGDPLEEAAYDLVHTRLVLDHLPERAAVLASAAEFDKVLAEFDDPGSDLWIYCPILVATRGRRPRTPVAARPLSRNHVA